MAFFSRVVEKGREFLSNLPIGWELGKRELKERYQGTSLGQLWLLLSPLVLIFIYTIIFSDFIGMRLNISNSRYAYSIYLIPGLLSWNFFSTILLRFTSLLIEKQGLIKKVPLPPYLYYIGAFLPELLIYWIGLGLGILFLLAVGHSVGPNFLWLPFLTGILALFAGGLGVIFSLFTPFFRDLKEFVNILTQLWFWATPIIYLKEMLLSKLPLLIYLNPLYYLIDPLQNLFLYSQFQWREVGIGALIAIGTAGVAGVLYKLLIPEIKDLL
ncbi:MAG: ABC transporter permease [Campylobacterales bacterium]